MEDTVVGKVVVVVVAVVAAAVVVAVAGLEALVAFDAVASVEP